MTNEELDRLQALCDGARPGNWKAVNDNADTEYYPFYVINDDESEGGEWFAEIRVGDWDTAQFIAAARTALPALIAEVRRLTERCEAAERDLDIERDCLTCALFDECPDDCDRHGNKWIWRGPQPTKEDA